MLARLRSKMETKIQHDTTMICLCFECHSCNERRTEICALLYDREAQDGVVAPASICIIDKLVPARPVGGLQASCGKVQTLVERPNISKVGISRGCIGDGITRWRRHIDVPNRQALLTLDSAT